MGLVYRASRMEFECDAVLLDMDGVLVDSTACERRQQTGWGRWSTLAVSEGFQKVLNLAWNWE
jgi:beta-phosphoglucomutase-like phosphatase (HAD superfamily)